MAKKIEYIKGKDGAIGAPKVKRQTSIHAAALDWIRDNPSEFKRWAGHYAAISGNGVVAVADSDEELWKKIRRNPEAPANPLCIYIPGLNEA